MMKPRQVSYGLLAFMAMAVSMSVQTASIARFEVGIVIKNMCEVRSARSIAPQHHAKPGVSCMHKRSYRVVPPHAPSTRQAFRAKADDMRLRVPVWTIEF